MSEVKLGVIGGSGLYQIEGLTDIEELKVDTPFGQPSDVITVGTLEGARVAFLPRHGRGHTINPSEIPVKANIYALKSLGVERIIAINSCGSYKEEIAPGHLLIPDQIIDRTKGRPSTFFEGGIVAHVAFADPFCSDLSDVLYKAAQSTGTTVHKGGTFVVMEGPQFSTKAESYLHKAWGASVIGMTVVPEAKLAREAEICYASVACVTDYDCWHQTHESVTMDMILAVMGKNMSAAKQIIKTAASIISQSRDCSCASALENAIVTSPKAISETKKKELDLLIGKYAK
ncbi:MAG: S-methyl-5'-thioadenosine phosphorylase [Chloroflexi bacterium]|jgi:5'-methylthioadenosine phosphorylase|nr:S-methyl-5'-thioadenosine phosphorylase [Chloroflexota bacterium]MBT7080844.1 S-methyl-5'-thioadenosine phosphorylase [Chloroflexota bacterium]MBT7290172.1 S-methyl-5'-thioadenosine phosphorylase [Chloroflexota bacterium]